MRRIYLDWAATAIPNTEILGRACELACAKFGNPSSVHTEGREARKALEEERASCVKALGGGSLVFTSGGTESNGIVLYSFLRRKEKIKAIVGLAEHASVYEAALALERLGITLRFVRPEDDGRVSPSRIAESIDSDTALVALMYVNNETGAKQEIEEIAEICKTRSRNRGRRIHFHVDAVQALGKLPFSPLLSGIDSASMSGHKIGAPRGIGALWLRKPLEPLFQGGGQETGVRSGTENLLGALAFSEALSLSLSQLEETRAKAENLMARLLNGLGSIPGAGPLPRSRAPMDERFSPFIASLSFPGLPGETMTRALDDKGIAVSTGSACSSTKKTRRVLEAMGLDEESSSSAIRISIGGATSASDIDAFLQAASEVYRGLGRK